MEEEIKNYSTVTIVITVIAVAAILVLAFLLYYYSTKPAPVIVHIAPAVRVIPKIPVKNPIVPLTPVVAPTNVVIFAPPANLPTVQKSGNCWVNSTAAPFRADAWRCMVGNSIYDPCFSTTQKDFVYCQVNTDVSTGFLIKLTKALPKPQIPKVISDNWAWFLQLRDGTYCSPFTGTRPFFGPNQVAFYGCDSKNPAEQIDLLGDITKGNVWTAEEAILTKSGASWTIKSTQQVDINTIWQ